MVDVEAATSSRLQRARAAVPEGGSIASLWCGDAACRSLCGNLGRVGDMVVGSVGRVLEGTVGLYVEAAAPDELVCLGCWFLVHAAL
jgi:hypothetical protein